MKRKQIYYSTRTYPNRIAYTYILKYFFSGKKKKDRAKVGAIKVQADIFAERLMMKVFSC